MTKAKRLIEIKKELRKVRKKMNRLKNINEKYINKNFYYYIKDVSDYCFPKNVTEYTIITRMGIKYIINNLMTNYFPDIDFKDIIYVSKIIHPIDSKNNNVWNSDRGFYNWKTEEGWIYFHNAENKYNVVEVIGDYLD